MHMIIDISRSRSSSIKVRAKLIDDLKKSLPELPDKKKGRRKEYGLNAYEANVLASQKKKYLTITKGI